MGGGPRTFPGGVNKWQWKRMMVKRREEREVRRLEREKEVYTLRQRAEVLAAHPELEQPWEKLTTFPLPGTSPQQQLSRLVGRFQKPADAEDLWTQRDGPQQNHSTQVAGVHPNHQSPSHDGHTDATQETDRKDHVPTMQSYPGGAGQHVAKVAAINRNKEAFPIGKSVQDYLDSFESDPLGLHVHNGTSRSTKERHRDPLGLVAGESNVGIKRRGLAKHR